MPKNSPRVPGAEKVKEYNASILGLPISTGEIQICHQLWGVFSGQEETKLECQNPSESNRRNLEKINALAVLDLSYPWFINNFFLSLGLTT